MDYSQLLRRSWDILLAQKYLIILGVLAALGGTGGNNFNWQTSSSGNGEGSFPFPPNGQFDFSAPPFEDLSWLWPLSAAVILLLVGVAIVVGLVIWVVSVVAQGGLVAGVQRGEEGETTSFGMAWSAAWAKVWRLLGISLIPAIPMLILLAMGIGTFVLVAGMAAFSLEEIGAAFGMGAVGLGVCLACLLIPILIVLDVLRIFALRACMLEDSKVIESYKRGATVIRENSSEFIALFLLRVGIGIAIGIVLFLPGMIMAFCCILWPLLLLVRGAIAAYFSTMWTLAWRQWTAVVETPQLPDTASSV